LPVNLLQARKLWLIGQRVARTLPIGQQLLQKLPLC
jgi:hypothetical protein